MTIPGIAGRPRWQPTPRQRTRVQQLRDAGQTVKAIARKLGVTRAVLRRECHEELGMPPVLPSSTLLEKAMQGDVDAAIRWLQRRGDREPETAGAMFDALCPEPPPHLRQRAARLRNLR
jgi:transposase-like protein